MDAFSIVASHSHNTGLEKSCKKREAKIRKFTEDAFDEKLHIGNHEGLRKTHFILFLMAIVFLILACSGPNYASGKEK